MVCKLKRQARQALSFLPRAAVPADEGDDRISYSDSRPDLTLTGWE